MSVVVTAYYEIKSKFPTVQYWKWIENFCNVPFKVVIFTSPNLVHKFKDLRKNLSDKTIIAPLEFKDLFHNKFYNEYETHYQMDYNKSHSPELYIIWAEKVKFVMRAIEMKAFSNSDDVNQHCVNPHYVWCDIGAFRQTNFMEKYETFPSLGNNIFYAKNKMNFLMIQPFESSDLISGDGIKGQTYGAIRLGGGIHAGNVEAWTEYDKLWDLTLQKYFDKRKFAGQDQCVMGTIYLNNPNLFNIIRPSFKREDGDPWFYLLLCWS